MKTLFVAALAAAIALPTALYASDDSILVQSAQNARHAWVDRISKDLGKKMAYTEPVSGSAFLTGAVSVRFTTDSAGRPQGMTVTRRSGSKLIDNAAMRAVSKLNGLYPLPDGMATNQPFRADLIYAENEDQLAKLGRDLARDHARMAKARVPGEPTEIALSAAGNSGV